MRTKNGKETAKDGPAKSRFGKGDVRYWRDRIFKATYPTPEGVREVPEWSVKIQYRGNRTTFPLHTANRDDAATAARDLYTSIVGTRDWDRVLQEQKPTMARPQPGTEELTLGKLIEEASAVASAKTRTVQQYAHSLRQLGAQIAGVSDKGKFDGRSGGNAKWLEKVDRIPLSKLSPQSIDAWRRKRIRRHDADAVAQRRAKISANTTIRNAKALFAPQIVEKLRQRLALPASLPFEGLRPERAPAPRYRSQIDADALIVAANTELRSASPDAYKAFILALFGGLRRREIDNLKWSAVRESDRTIRVEATATYGLKSEDSAGDVPVTEEVISALSKLRGDAPDSAWVIGDDGDPKSKTSPYRAYRVFDALISWLRSKGVTGNKPIHTLRKEFGSLINQEHGVFQASRLLRHSRIDVTAAYYLDQKERVTLGKGHLL